MYISQFSEGVGLQWGNGGERKSSCFFPSCFLFCFVSGIFFWVGEGGGYLFWFFFFCGVVYFLLFSFPGLKAADRTSVQNEWMEEKIPVIVATISFGMGVDKANVRCVRLCVVHHQRLKPE